MPRHTRTPVYKIRYRKPGKVFGAKFSFSKDRNDNNKGRVLSKTKVSYEEIYRVGEYLPFSLRTFNSRVN